MEVDVMQALRDPRRVAAVKRSGLLDTPPEARFDRVTRLAARILEAPLALLNLLDDERQFTKSCFAPDAWPTERNADLGDSYCKLAVASSAPLVIENARRDPRVAASRFTTDLGICAYLGVPLSDSGGQVLGTLCVADLESRRWSEDQIDTLRDLAALVSIEIELREQVRETEHAELLFQRAEQDRREKMALLESVSEGIYGTDAEGRCTFLNPAGASLLGYEPEEVLGREMHPLIHHTHADGSPYPVEECPITGACATGVPVRFTEELLWRKDGTSFPAEYASSPIRQDGRVAGAVVTFRDVSERKHEEEAQRFLWRTAEELAAASLDYTATLRSLVRLSVPALGDWCGIYTRAPDGGIERLEIAHADPALKSTTERLRAYPIDPGGQHPVVQVLRTGEAVLIEDIPPQLVDAVAHDEEHRRLLQGMGLRSAIVVPLNARRRTLGALLVVTAGQRRLGEQDLVLAKEFAYRAGMAVDNALLLLEAQEASRAKSEFLATVSHELRTPLNAVTGYAELMREGIPEPLPERSREYVERIRLSANHLLRLIEEILTFSRLEAGREQVRPEPVAVARLAEEVAAIIEPAATERGLRFRCSVPADAPRMRTDPHKLRQVLVNVLDNAVKFTPAGEVGFEVRVEGDEVLFTVRDTGIGIAREHQERIFEAFRQLEQSSTREVGGTGLGLTVARRLTLLLGGSLSLHSTPGEGTTVLVRLPLTGPEDGDRNGGLP